jgi:hypothetical protein
MKTVIEKATKISHYIFADNVPLTPNEFNIVTPDFNIGHLDAERGEIIENVTPPEDWIAGMYFYDNGQWVINPEGVPQPRPPEPEVVNSNLDAEGSAPNVIG